MTEQQPPHDEHEAPPLVELLQGERLTSDPVHLDWLNVPEDIPDSIFDLEDESLRQRACEAWRMVHRLRLLVNLWIHFVVS